MKSFHVLKMQIALLTTLVKDNVLVEEVIGAMVSTAS